jgi:hypothetical protein
MRAIRVYHRRFYLCRFHISIGQPVQIRCAEYPAVSLGLKTRDDVFGNRQHFDPQWISGIACRPNASLAALDRKRATHHQLMLDIEA